MFLCFAVVVPQVSSQGFFHVFLLLLKLKKVFLSVLVAFLTTFLEEKEHSSGRPNLINKNLSFQILCGYETSYYN